jgi:uncharacterized pyridoxal phosphate-containing UPF0001 family protein
MATAIANSLEHVRIDIARACRDAGRDPAEVRLIAVSKTFGAHAIESVIDVGQCVFGENSPEPSYTSGECGRAEGQKPARFSIG